MSTQFRCNNPARRLRILQPALGGGFLNGIDWLEVLDRKAEELASPRQRTLLVRLFQPAAGLTVDNIRVTALSQMRETLDIEWAHPADNVPIAANVATAAEAGYFASLSEPERILVVRTREVGGFSRYRLSLIGNAQALDPVLAHVEFSFKVECPSPFDCKQPEEPCETVESNPNINYLARDYGSFKQVILDRLSLLQPDFRERNAADAEIAVVELIAYAADRLAYFQDAVSTEAYLGTARRRVSVKRHARLLDYFMHEGSNARAFVCLEVSADGVTIRRDNPDGSVTAFLTQCGEPPRLAPSTDVGELIREREALVFEPLHDAVLYTAHNQIQFYTWEDNECCLPKGATRATLKDNPSDRLRLKVGDVLVFEEVRGRDTDLPGDADPARRQAVRLTHVHPAASSPEDAPGSPRVVGPLVTDPLSGQAIVEVEWASEDALDFPLCISTIIDGIPRSNISAARGNVLLVDHGQTVPTERLPEIVDARKYRPALTKKNVTYACPFDYFSARSHSAKQALRQDPHESLAQVSLSGAQHWKPQRDLLRSDQFAAEFVVEVEQDGRATLRFGDGILGRLPEPGLVARYRQGNGLIGNVGAEAIAHIVSNESDILSVRNPLPAVGGGPPESIEEVRQYAPQAFRTQRRAVTEEDYANAAEQHPDVQKAVARRLWTGSWHTVYVTIDRRGGRDLDPEFVAELEQRLDAVRLAGETLEIEAPTYVGLEIVLPICIAAQYRRDDVRVNLMRVLSAQRLPSGELGFFHPDNWTFGSRVYFSALAARVMSVPGVLHIDMQRPELRFQRVGSQTSSEALAQGFIELERFEIPRLDNSLAAPENGTLELLLLGGR